MAHLALQTLEWLPTTEIDIAHPAGGHDPEFVQWRWEQLPKIVDLIVPFKRPVYEQVVRKFKRFARDASYTNPLSG